MQSELASSTLDDTLWWVHLDIWTGYWTLGWSYKDLMQRDLYVSEMSLGNEMSVFGCFVLSKDGKLSWSCCWEYLLTPFGAIFFLCWRFCILWWNVLSGASSQEIDEAEEALGCQFPLAARLLYRLCNGQEIPEDDDEHSDDEHQNEAHYVGLIGGYNFIHHFVNVHLLSLRQVRYFLLGPYWQHLQIWHAREARHLGCVIYADFLIIVMSSWGIFNLLCVCV